MYNEREDRIALNERTSSIDERNFNKVHDISVIAEQQLKKFDRSLKSEEAADYYERLKQDMTSDAPVISLDNVAYELEVAETDFMPELREKAETTQRKSAAIVLNLRGKLIIAVTTTIMLLLGILMIYNAVLINQLNAEIAQDEQTLIIEEARLRELEAKILAEEAKFPPEVLDMIFGTGHTVTANNLRTGGAETYSKPTNWFDAICEFFARLFGGK